MASPPDHKHTVEKPTNAAPTAGRGVVQPSLFDIYYEEVLTEIVSVGYPNQLSQKFTELVTDIERTDFIIKLPFIQNFEIKQKAGTKCLEKAVKYREEGNKLFQADKATQAVLFYNKSISYCPHPLYADYQAGSSASGGSDSGDQQKIREVHLPDVAVSDDTAELLAKRRSPSKYEVLALSYANRSAALRRLAQFEDCLKDISRAAKFGYPKENVYKLWERKGKCYQGLKRYDLAAKCYRQAMQCLSESALSDSQRAGKAVEIQTLLKELRNLLLKHGTIQKEVEVLPDTASPQVVKPTTAAQGESQPAAPERSHRKHSKLSLSGTGAGGNTNSGPARPETPATQPTVSTLSSATSQVSISHISTTGSIRSEVEVPELSYGSNARLPSASSAIDLQFCPDRGRFMVATQDLNPGDVILREEPYAAVLESVFRVNHCANCLKKTSTPIPCFECATVQYCGEPCRDEGWVNYHKFECGILAYLEPSQYLGRLPHLALRIITKTGLQNLVRHTQKMLPVSPGSKEARNNADPIQMDPTSYRSVHNLASNTDKRSLEDLIKKTAEAIFMSKCLKFNGFYGDPTGFSVEQQRAEIFVSSLILRHLQIAATNGLEMAECILKNNDITKFDIIPIGGAIFPTMSFFNHSCYPNAMRLGYQNQQLVRVIRRIPKGAEVNIDYGFDFYATPLEFRHKKALANYHFRCECVACTHKWPVYDRLVDRPPQYRRKLTPELAEMVGAHATNYETAMEHLIRLDINKAMPLFAEYLANMSEIIVHPDARYLDCEEAFKQCLWLENRGHKILKAKRKNTQTQ